MDIIAKARLRLRITAAVFDSEIEDVIKAAIKDLMIAGVTGLDIEDIDNNTDPLRLQAIMTYVKAHFGEADQYDRLKAAYDEQKAQLQTATGYTTWTEVQ